MDEARMGVVATTLNKKRSFITLLILSTKTGGFIPNTIKLTPPRKNDKTFSIVPQSYRIEEKVRETEYAKSEMELHRRFVARNRQAFITSKTNPIHVSIKDSPSRKWLSLSKDISDQSISQVYINGTILDKSISAVSNRFGWFESDAEADTSYRMELIAEINVDKPGYLHMLPYTQQSIKSRFFERRKEEENKKEMLWITGFSLTKRWGGITSLCIKTGIMKRVGEHMTFYQSILDLLATNNEVNSKISFGWPNEVNSVPKQTSIGEYEDALLVTDGFLVPGRENGGLYLVKHPASDYEWKVCLAGGHDNEWFYHRAIWIDLTNDGRQSILTARAKRPSIIQHGDVYTTSSENFRGNKNGQLVWLECPKPYRYDTETGTPLDVDGTVFDPFSARHVPWKVRVLDEGPDVMFSVADLDINDGTIEVIASQFFGKRLSLHSITIGPKPYVSFRRIIDNQSGTLFSSILADFDINSHQSNDRSLVLTKNVVIDSGSTVPTLKHGDSFSHVLVTSHESKFSNYWYGKKDGVTTSFTKTTTKTNHTTATNGGSLFSFRIPKNWKTDVWTKQVIATGFHVKGQLSNMINPGAPGFCYTFYPTQSSKKQRPLIAVSGDCAESAYIFRPSSSSNENSNDDPSTCYKLMCEIDIEATVGSLAIGYSDFCGIEGQSDGCAKIFIPAYEKNKILVFAMEDKIEL